MSSPSSIPTGTKVLMVIGHRPSQADGPYATPKGPNPPDENYTLCRPTDVAWDQQDNIFITDGYCNNRVVKYSPEGKFLAKNGGSAVGKGENEYNLPHGLQVDHQGNVYVADRGNNRYVVLDNNLKWKTAYTQYGTAWSDCISEGAAPVSVRVQLQSQRQCAGQLGQDRPDLQGGAGRHRRVGKFGHAGKLAPGFQVVHMMDCRNPNQIIVGEIESWRMQKFVLKGSK